MIEPSTWFKINQDLPPGVNDYPTLKGKQRFEALQTFNFFLCIYVTLHKLVVPSILKIGQTGGKCPWSSFGFWFLYHILIAWHLHRKTPGAAMGTVYLAWGALGFLPWMILLSFARNGVWGIGWHTISGLLTYVSSFVFTLFLLYRMRMPTTAFLFHLPNRIIPAWRLAVPYFMLGGLLGLSAFILEIHV